jgi:fluoride exporter
MGLAFDCPAGLMAPTDRADLWVGGASERAVYVRSCASVDGLDSGSMTAGRQDPDPARSEVVGPDVDLAGPGQRRELAGHPWDVLGAIAAGGVVGAQARYGLGLLLPHSAGAWPWSTLLVNLSGCFLIGILMVVITELVSAHRLVRPFLGVGVLGGYTTFSTATVDSLTLLDAGRALAALGYTMATCVLAVAVCALGVVATRLLAGRPPGPPETRP